MNLPIPVPPPMSFLAGSTTTDFKKQTNLKLLYSLFQFSATKLSQVNDGFAYYWNTKMTKVNADLALKGPFTLGTTRCDSMQYAIQ